MQEVMVINCFVFGVNLECFSFVGACACLENEGVVPVKCFSFLFCNFLIYFAVHMCKTAACRSCHVVIFLSSSDLQTH